MNIKETINEAASRMNEPSIDNVVSTSNNAAQMYLASAKKVSRDIAKRHEWSDLVIPYTLETVVGEQEYDLPEDYKDILTSYLFNGTNNRAIPRETATAATARVSIGTASWSNTGYRIVRDKIRFTVAADTADNINYDYKSKYLAKDDDGYKETFTANEDEYVLDTEALILGIVADITEKYEFADTGSKKADYERELRDLINKDGGKFVVSASRESKQYPYPSKWNQEQGSAY